MLRKYGQEKSTVRCEPSLTEKYALNIRVDSLDHDYNMTIVRARL